MGFDPFTILAALLPVVIDGIKQGVSYLTGGPKATTVAELLQLQELDIKKLEIIAKLDSAENISRWVANFRALQRPLAVVIILVTYIVLMFHPVSQDIMTLVSQLAQATVFYLFGDRTLTYLKGKP